MFGTNDFADFLKTGPAFAFKADFIKADVVLCSGGLEKFTLRDGLVFFTALQQVILQAGRAIIERMVRDPGRSTQVSSSSRNLTSILAKYVLEWMERPLSTVFAFILHGYRATYVPMLASRGRVGRFSRSGKVQKLPACPSTSELSTHQMAPSGVIAHKRGRPALEPVEILSSVQRRARCTPLRDGDLEPRRSSPRWTFSLRFLFRAFPLFLGFTNLLFMPYLRYCGVWLQCPKPGDVRAWPDTLLPSRSTECEESRTNSPRSLLHGRPGCRQKCLVWRLAGKRPLGQGGAEFFRALPSAAPQAQKPHTSGHDS